MKAKITRIGTIDENGHPKGWTFDASGIPDDQRPGEYEFDQDGLKAVGGWTIAELREIIARALLDTEKAPE